MTGHIATAFDRELEELQKLILEMGELVHASIVKVNKAFKDGDLALAEQVKAEDKHIDHFDHTINELVAQIIALRAPSAIDLRLVLSALKISSNLERIGDYSKNLAKRFEALSELHQLENAPLSLDRVAYKVEEMLESALKAFSNRDVELAHKVIENDRDVDHMYNSLFRELLTFMMEDQRNISPCMHILFMIKYLERMGDHTTSISEHVIFLVTGEMPEDDRAHVAEEK